MSRLRAIVLGVGGGVVLATGLTAALDANGYCCDPWGVPGANAFIAAGTTVVDAITAAVTTLTTEIETGPLYTFTQGIGQMTVEQSKQEAASKLMKTGTIASDYALYLKGKQAEATQAAAEPAMLDETVANTMILADGQPSKRKITANYDRKLEKVMVAGPYANPYALVDQHLSTYCDYQDVADGVCETQAADDLQNGDATVATIYGGTSLTYSDAQRDAALALVQMIVVPQPLRTGLDAQRGAQDQALEADLLSDQAALSIAGYVLNSQVADRTRKSDTTSK